MQRDDHLQKTMFEQLKNGKVKFQEYAKVTNLEIQKSIERTKRRKRAPKSFF